MGCASPDRIVAATAEICVGEFRCPVTHPSFRDTGPSSHHCFAFPRTAVVIRHGKTRIAADASVATLYNEGQEYEREPVSPSGDACEWFGVSARLLRDVLAARDPHAAADERRPLRFTHAPVVAGLYLAQREIYVRATRTPVDELWLEEAVLDLTDRVLDAAYGAASSPATVSRRARDIVHDAQCLLARDLGAPLGLAAIADRVGASMFYLSRCFRLYTGQTLHAYRTQLRLRASLDSIESGERDLSQVALDCGFSSHSHFTAAFRDVFGTTPSHLRAAWSGRRRSR